MATVQGGCAAKKSSTFARLSRFEKTPRPRESEPCAWNTFFAISRPIVVTSGTDASLRMVATLHSGTAMPSGGVHPISFAQSEV